jgi:hypothetical protein
VAAEGPVRGKGGVGKQKTGVVAFHASKHSKNYPQFTYASNIDTFMKHTVSLQRSDRLLDWQRVAVLVCQIKPSQARTWVETNCRDAEPPPTWEEVEQAFRAHFAARCQSDNASDRLLNCKQQHREPAHAYCDRVLLLIDEAGRDSTDTLIIRKMLGGFRAGLRGSIRTARAATPDCDSVEKIRELALKLDDGYVEPDRRDTNTTSSRGYVGFRGQCFDCGQYGHKRGDLACRSRSGRREDVDSGPRQSTPGARRVSPGSNGWRTGSQGRSGGRTGGPARDERSTRPDRGSGARMSAGRPVRALRPDDDASTEEYELNFDGESYVCHVPRLRSSLSESGDSGDAAAGSDVEIVD